MNSISSNQFILDNGDDIDDTDDEVEIGSDEMTKIKSKHLHKDITDLNNPRDDLIRH